MAGGEKQKLWAMEPFSRLLADSQLDFTLAELDCRTLKSSVSAKRSLYPVILELEAAVKPAQVCVIRFWRIK